MTPKSAVWPLRHVSMRTVGWFALALGGAAACGDSTTTQPDAGGAADAVGYNDAVTQDAHVATDSGIHADAGLARDAGHYCVANNQITVGQTAVTVDPATVPSTNPIGTRSILSCIDRRPSLNLDEPLRFRGCLSFAGAVPTTQEISELEVTVFRAKDSQGVRVDPAYDRVTGADRSPNQIVHAASVISRNNVCPSGFQIEIGRNSLDQDRLLTARPYTIRVRSSTTTAQPKWVTMYYFDVVVRADALEEGATPCASPQNCSGRVDLLFVRQSALAGLVTASGANIPGAQNLSDGVGSGHAIMVANDCQDLLMKHAAGGFAPAPVATNYLSATYGWASQGTATSSVGVLLGLGFSGTSSSAPHPIFSATTVTRDGTCSENFGGSSVYAYPDSISVIRSGKETTLAP